MKFKSEAQRKKVMGLIRANDSSIISKNYEPEVKRVEMNGIKVIEE